MRRIADNERHRAARQQRRPDAYRAGRAAGLARVAETGRSNFAPPLADRLEWGHDWANYIAGWHERGTEDDATGRTD